MGTWGRREWLCTYCSGFCTSISFQALWQKYTQSADCHRQCTHGMLASVCAVSWAQDVLTEQNQKEHYPVWPPSPLGAWEEACHSGSHLAIPKDCRQTHEVLGLHCFSFSLCMKSTASKVYRGENKRLFLLWLLLLFCTTAQITKPRHFL